VKPPRQQQRRYRIHVHPDDSRCRNPQDAKPARKEKIERDSSGGDSGTEEHRPPGVAACVKCAHRDLLRDPRRHRQRQQCQDRGNLGAVSRRERTVLIDELHHRPSQHDEGGAAYHRQREPGLQRAQHQLLEFPPSILCPQAR